MSTEPKQPAKDGGAERRRFARYPLRLDALIVLRDNQAVPCVVRDFCVAGMFVALEPALLATVVPNTVATLYFALMVDGKQQDFQLALRVRRLVNSGIGCAFEDPDEGTIKFLQRLAAPPPSEAEDRQPSGAPVAGADEIQTELGVVMDRFAHKLVSDFTKAVNDALFLNARDASSNLQQTYYTDAQNQLRRRAKNISEDLPALLLKGVTDFGNPLDRELEGGSEGGASELSLIDIDEFEEFLTMSELISELEPGLKEPLYELDRRLSEVAGRQIKDADNPFGPAIICNVFGECLKGLEAEKQPLNVIYKTLGGLLDKELPKLIGDANKLLVERGVLPVVEREKAKFKRPPGASPPGQPEDAFDPSASEPPPDLDIDETNSGFQIPPGGWQPPPGAPRQPGGPGSPQQVGVAPAPPSPPPGVQPAPAGGFGSAAGPGSVTAAPPAETAGVSQPPAAEGGYLQGGAMPGGYVQAAPPTVPAGVQISPAAAGHGAVTAAPGAPQMPDGVQVRPAGAGGFSPAGTFAGFGAPAAAVGLPPTLQQAYSTAQAQLALRRQILPTDLAETIGPSSAAPVFDDSQVIAGLNSLQPELGAAETGAILDVDALKARLAEAIGATADGATGQLGQSQTDAIEVIANLFRSLIEDALLSKPAKSMLTRLQVPVHKTALADPSFFEVSDHPVRQLLNRVAQLRDIPGSAGASQVATLIDNVNASYQTDPSVIQPILNEIDAVIRSQRGEFDDNAQHVVHDCERQQSVLRQRRDQNLEETTPPLDLPEEWNRWLDRSKALVVGDRLLMNANTERPYPVNLIWIGDRYNPFVFVDDRGNKTSSLTLQQVAMYLRRGVLKSLSDQGDGAVDRALYGMVNRIHEEVESHATNDELTGFLNRKSFIEAVDGHLPEAGERNPDAVLAIVSIDNLKDVNDTYGAEVGDDFIRQVAKLMEKDFGGRQTFRGRLGGSEFGLFFPKSVLQSAYKKLQSSVARWSENGLEHNDTRLEPKLHAGVTSVRDGLTGAEQLLMVASEALGTARTTPDKPVYVAGSENRYREQLKAMVGYIGKAIDRDRLVLLSHIIEPVAKSDAKSAVHLVVSAEDRNGRLVPPAIFARALTQSDRAFEVDEWMLKRALQWMVEHADDLEEYAAIVVPISHAAIARDNLSTLIVNELMQTAVPPGRLCFEVADQDAVNNLTEVQETISTLREFGCRFILDEFGSGQGSYDYVKDLAVDFVTIKSTFIADARHNPKDFAMAKSINELVHFLGKPTIAKRTLADDVDETLREIGIDYIYDQTRTSRLKFEAV